MIDKENLRIGLEEVSDFFFEMYKKETDEHKITKAKEYCDAAEDALSLLKEQEPKAAIITHQNEYCKDGICPSCGHELETNMHPKYCGYCGQAVEWDD